MRSWRPPSWSSRRTSGTAAHQWHRALTRRWRSSGNNTCLPSLAPSLTPVVASSAPIAASRKKIPIPPTEASLAFARLFSDVTTTLDIAPVRRPQLLGSLTCALEELSPATLLQVVIVEDCAGTSSEEVLQRVQQCAVRCAQEVERLTWQPFKQFLLQTLTERYPVVLQDLQDLDLSLQLKLLLMEEDFIGGTAAVSDAAHEKEAAKSEGPTWRCTASLYDPWQTHPQYEPVLTSRQSSSGRDKMKERTTGVLWEHGPLQTVVAHVLRRVSHRLKHLRTNLLQDAAQEANRYLAEAGTSFPAMALTAALQHASEEAVRRQRREVPSPQPAPVRRTEQCRCDHAWVSSCVCYVDSTSQRPIGARLCLQRTAGNAHRSAYLTSSSKDTVLPPPRVVLSESATLRGWAPLVAPDPAQTLGKDCLYTNISDSRNAGQRAFTAATLTAWVEGNIGAAPRRQWADGPVDLTRHMLEAAAVASSTIAEDLFASDRCLDACHVEATHLACNTDLFARSTHRSECLPAMTRWTSYAGRAVLNDFLHAFLSDDRGQSRQRHHDWALGGNDSTSPSSPTDVAAALLPPLWPRLRLVAKPSESAHRLALRELLRAESGLRCLTRALMTVPSSNTLQTPLVLEYDAEMVLAATPAATGSSSPPRDGETAAAVVADRGASLRIGAVWYASVAAAARAHAPWATPLCSDDSAGRGSAATKLDVPPPALASSVGRAHYRVRVLAATDCLLAHGFVRATWHAPTGALTCYRADPASTPRCFWRLDTTAGLLRFVRYCKQHPKYVTAKLPPDATDVGTLRTLLQVMMTGRKGRPTSTVSKPEAAEVRQPPPLHDSAFTFDLPFDAGAATLRDCLPTASEESIFPLLSLFRSFHPQSPIFATLSAAATSSPTFFHHWGPTKAWLHPNTSLQAVVECHGDTADVDDERDAEEAGGRGNSHPRAKASLVLCLEQMPGVRATVEKLNAPADTATRTRVVCSTADPAWIARCYVAIRDSVLSLPPEEHKHAREMLQEASCSAEDRWSAELLWHCADLASLTEAVLCSMASDPPTKLTARRLLSAVLGKDLLFREQADVVETRLAVAQTSKVLLCTSALPKELPRRSRNMEEHRGSIATDLLRVLAPDASEALHELLQFKHQLGSLWAAGQVNELHVRHFRVRVEWEKNAGTTPAPAASQGSHRAADTPVFAVEVLRASSSSPLAAPAPDTSAPAATAEKGETACVVLRRSGPSLLAVLRGLQHHPSLQLRNWHDAIAAQGFPKVAHTVLARRFNLAEVTAHYDATTGHLTVRGGPTSTGGAPTVLAEVTATWPQVLKLLFPLYRRLLNIGETGMLRKKSLQNLLDADHRFLTSQLCHMLGCPPSEVRGTQVAQRRDDTCTIFLPSSLLGLTTAGLSHDAANAPAGFYVSTTHCNPARAAQVLRAYLCYWLCCVRWPVPLDADDAGKCRVRCDVTPPASSADAVMSVPRHVQPMSLAATMTPPQAVPRRSVIDAAHAAISARLRMLLTDRPEQQTVLKLSQTFGLELIYTACLHSDSERLPPRQRSDDDVELLRERWDAQRWAPEQILHGEIAVLQRLVLSAGAHNLADAHEQVRAVVASLLLPLERLPSLPCGAATVSRRAFCVSFLRRYFGWRMCERDDVADLCIAEARDRLVVFEHVTDGSRATVRQWQSRSSPAANSTARTGASAVARATLQLGEISSAKPRSVRLAQVLASGSGETREVAQAAMWDICARRIKDIFDVSRLMSAAEVDAGMLRFMTDAARRCSDSTPPSTQRQEEVRKKAAR